MPAPVAGYLVSADALRKMREAHRVKRNRVNASRYGGGGHSRMLVRIDGLYPGTSPYPASISYQATQLLTKNTGYTTALSGGFVWGYDSNPDSLLPIIDLRSAGIYEEVYTGDMEMVPTGCIVEAFYLADEDGVVTWYFDGPTLGELFAVDVTTDGGTAGDRDTQCDFTYEVFDLKGNSLATAKTPLWARPQWGAMVAATRGMAYWGEDQLYLYQVDEMQDLEICVDSGV